MMSPSVGIWQRLMHVFTSRWFIAIMIPRPGSTRTPSIPAISATRPAHAPDAFTVTRASMSMLLAGARAAHAGPGHAITVPMDGHHGVVGEHARAALLRAAGQRPHRLPNFHVAVRHAEHARDIGVAGAAPGAAPSPDRSPRSRSPVAAHPCGELVRVGRVVPRRGHEEPAGVLDAVGGDPAQDAVLADALLGCPRVLDRVATSGVQQAVEAAARALGEIRAVDQHHVQPAQRRVPGHARARGAATDHEHIGAERGHGCQPTRLPRAAAGAALDVPVLEFSCLRRTSRTSA